MRKLSTEELERLISGGESFVLINVLPADQFDATRIPGARNIPLEEPHFASRVGEAVGGKDKRIVVYCASEDCPASTKAAGQLEAAGFRNVFDYKEGAQGWDAEQIVRSDI